MTDKSLVNTLQALVASKQRRQLKALDPRGAIGSKRVSVDYSAPARTGGGIAGPLVETQGVDGADTRTYHPAKTIVSSDGLRPYQVRRVATVTMKDANNETLPMVFNDVP